MATTKPFDKYEIQISGGNSGRVGLVMFYSGTAFVGRIDFYPDGATLAGDYLWHPSSPSVNYVVLHMPMSRFDSVVATLRQESPLSLYCSADPGSGATTAGTCYLFTGTHEPVGELAG